MSITPDHALEELLEFGRRFGDGLERLALRGAPEVGATARDEVYRDDSIRLYRYRGESSSNSRIPILIVYALVNRPYMMDLEEDRSLIRGLLRADLDVYLLDWGYPQRADRFLTLEDYLQSYLLHCVDWIRDAHGAEKLNVLGICQGGVFALCFAAMHPERIRNLVTMVTPVDFHTPDNTLTRIARKLDVDLLVDTFGNVPGSLLNATFLSLSPFRLGSQKYVHLADNLQDDAALANFLRMERWIFDSPDQAGEAFRQFVKGTFQENGLIEGTMLIDGQRIDLRAIRQPVLNVYASRDHLVPPTASRALRAAIGSVDYQELEFDSGHIGIYVSARAQEQIPRAIGDWLRAR